MLLLWVVISAALVAVALVLNTSGHKACTQSMGTACPSRPVPQHADASHLMKPRLLAEAFRRDSRQAAQSFIWTDKAHMIEIHAMRALTLAACGDHASALRTEAAARARQLGLIP